MKLWYISQNVNQEYDTYDSAVVAAESEDSARQISPSGAWGGRFSSWCATPEQVNVEYLGEAVEGTAAGVVLGSFNAG